MKNIQVGTPEENLSDFAVIEIDGKDCQTLRDFYENIAKIMHFPDYFGFNLDSLDELLNDLSWIEDEKLLLHVSNSELFLCKERTESKIFTLLDLIDATCEDWKWFEPEADLEDDDEDFVPKKMLKVIFSKSDRIQDLLHKWES